MYITEPKGKITAYYEYKFQYIIDLKKHLIIWVILTILKLR